MKEHTAHYAADTLQSQWNKYSSLFSPKFPQRLCPTFECSVTVLIISQSLPSQTQHRVIPPQSFSRMHHRLRAWLLVIVDKSPTNSHKRRSLVYVSHSIPQFSSIHRALFFINISVMVNSTQTRHQFISFIKKKLAKHYELYKSVWWRSKWQRLATSLFINLAT